MQIEIDTDKLVNVLVQACLERRAVINKMEMSSTQRVSRAEHEAHIFAIDRALSHILPESEKHKFFNRVRYN